MTAQDNEALQVQLTQLDDELYNLLQSHLFFQKAMLQLASDNCEPETWVAGATAIQQWLKQSSSQVMQQLEGVRQSSCRG